MRITTVWVLVLLALHPMSGLASTQRAMSPAEERSAWLGAAKAIPAGVPVKVELGSGRRITGTLISVTDDAVLVKQRGRSRPALEIPLADVSRIERVSKEGVSFAKVIAGGAAAGAGAFLTIFAFMLMLSD